MPIHEYAAAEGGCPICRNGIELLERLADPPLAVCPECGATLHRIVSAPQVVSGQAHVLRESHVARHGFTQYRRVGKGNYEKTAGKGPETISGD
ncbi:MAG TPA: zinc ribbon domain-containing protein [Rhodanobacteraceae bacterium]|nr:zinc ribbon domain-containing protein [Rhodanobacteraceae bacterium]